MKPVIYGFSCLTLLLFATIYTQHKAIQIERDINNALRRRVESQMACSKVLQESRQILKEQIRLRKQSDSLADMRNKEGYDNRDEYDRLTAKLY
jgi:hypothetical protein